MNIDQQLGIFERPEKVLDVITYILDSLIAENSIPNQTKSIFHSRGNLTTSLSSFLKSKKYHNAGIFSFMKCSTSCYIAALVLLDRLKTKDQNYKISSANAHKLMMTAILIAVKAIDDDYYSQKYYSLVAGLNLAQLNKLESQFLDIIEYKTFITPQTFYSYSQKLQEIYEIYIEKKQPKSHQSQDDNTLQTHSVEDNKEIKKNEKISQHLSSMSN